MLHRNITLFQTSQTIIISLHIHRWRVINQVMVAVVRVDIDEWQMTRPAYETRPLTRISFEMQMRFFSFIKISSLNISNRACGQIYFSLLRR